MIIFEFDKKYRGVGRFFSSVGGKKKFRRIWLGWTAITWTSYHLKELHDYIANGNTIWQNG